ncbi:MAG: DUF362 domain-containing protein [Bacillota bacterium]
MTKPVVSIVKYQDPYASLKQAIDMVDGLKDLRKEDKILIKPNIVGYDFNYPQPFGVQVTSTLMEALVKLLAENGFNNLTIAEGTIGDNNENVGQRVFEAIGYGKLRDRYGVKLVDFFDEKHVPMEFEDGLKLSLAQSVAEADKIINFPVMKTHNQCIISLGVKNLKGVLDKKSRQACHGAEMKYDLDLTFNQVIDKLPVALCIIDAVYALARGPAASGEFYRKDLIIASRDTYACDLIGTEIMGRKVADVPHLKVYAERHDRSLDLDSVEVKGESVDAHRQYIENDFDWLDDDTGPKGFAKRGISGLAVRKWDHSLCTYCSGLYSVMLVSLMSSFNGTPFPNVEVITGKRMKATPGFEHTVLFGKCPINTNKDNPDVNNAIKVRGCPPNIDDFVKGLAEIGVNIDLNQIESFRGHMYKKFMQQGHDMSLFNIE